MNGELGARSVGIKILARGREPQAYFVVCVDVIVTALTR